jgi:hypothetical protein
MIWLLSAVSALGVGFAMHWLGGSLDLSVVAGAAFGCGLVVGVMVRGEVTFR